MPKSTWTNEQFSAEMKSRYTMGREIGDIAPIANPGERENAKYDLKYDMQRYHGPAWTLPWSDAHHKLIAMLQALFLDDDFHAAIVVMPRGSGKTTLSRYAVDWAVRHGHCRWPLLIEADDDSYKKQMRSFSVDYRSNILLAEDFPETIGVFRKMTTPKSAPGLMCRGEPCHAEFKAGLIIMPTNYRSLELGTAGGIISGGGITGSVRGANMQLPTGEIIRPDTVLANDIQTRESAKSPKQVRDRCEIMGGDIFGTGGPGVKVNVLVTQTVIANDDAACRMLGPEFPQYRKLKVRWVERWPTRMDLWETYSILLRRLMLEEQPLDLANDFYVANRECRHGLGWHKRGMDHGAEVYWDHRIDRPYISSLQSFMSWLAVDRTAAMAEGQNEPEDDTVTADVSYATRIQIIEKITPLQHMQIPNDALCLSAFIDVQNEVLVGGVMATCSGFKRYVVDYVTFPDQKSSYWSRRSIKRKLTKLWGSQAECWYEGLIALTTQIESAEYYRRNGQRMHLTIGLIDARDGDAVDTVFKFCVDYGQGLWFPSYGIYVGASTNSLNHGSEAKAWQTRRRDWGPNWNMKNDATRGHDHVNFDSNYFKSTVHAGILTPEVDPMSLQLYDGNHDLLAAHLRGEYPIKTEGRGRECTEWKARPNEDNELLDVLAGCSVGASVKKVVIPGTELMVRRKRKGRARMRTG